MGSPHARGQSRLDGRLGIDVDVVKAERSAGDAITAVEQAGRLPHQLGWNAALADARAVGANRWEVAFGYGRSGYEVTAWPQDGVAGLSQFLCVFLPRCRVVESDRRRDTWVAQQQPTELTAPDGSDTAPRMLDWAD
ncbi:hypothetical protein [Fodinicola feengrottensis]|uniref:hypothetical protein n=1 Tax=Fodinicola feengrottensis TaxID=435914 RepID=UPI0013D0BF3E|nr:hypothetical protein [Fodinicola feengrottensis]